MLRKHETHSQIQQTPKRYLICIYASPLQQPLQQCFLCSRLRAHSLVLVLGCTSAVGSPWLHTINIVSSARQVKTRRNHIQQADLAPQARSHRLAVLVVPYPVDGGVDLYVPVVGIVVQRGIHSTGSPVSFHDFVECQILTARDRLLLTPTIHKMKVRRKTMKTRTLAPSAAIYPSVYMFMILVCVDSQYAIVVWRNCEKFRPLVE